MNKCVSCGADLPSQTRFCGLCGTKQPSGTDAGEADNIETVLSNPYEEKPPVDSPPSPPQPPQNAGQMQREDAGISPSGQQEHKAQANSPAEQPNNPPSNPGQPLQPFDEAQPFPLSPHLQQPHSSYQQAQPLYGEYQQQPSSPYNFQQPSPSSPYNFQQPSPSSPYNFQQSSPPYGNYQPPPQPQQSYGNYQSMPLYGDYQPPPQAYGNYQQTPPPVFQPSGIHGTDTMTDPRLNAAGIKPIPTATPPKAPEWRKWAIIAVVAVLVLAGSGILVARLLYPPLAPTINVTSDYRDSGAPAGSDGTTLQVTGKQFSNNSPITFLIDNTTIKQDMQTQSDANGNVTATLTITSAWPMGQHKLIAHDANNNTTNTGIPVSIVQQGHAGTPGPNGAPTNTANFKINVQLHVQNGSSTFSQTWELDVKGRSDSQGGTVCSPIDNGPQDRAQSMGPNNTLLTRVSTYVCGDTGSYKEGQVIYDQTLETDTASDAGGMCELVRPQIAKIHMTGTYTASHQFSGDITVNAVGADQYHCTGDLIINNYTGATGTWTGTVNNS